MFGKNLFRQASEVRLDRDEVADVWEAFYKIPYAQQAHDAFVNMVLACPPEVNLKALDWKNTPELELILQEYILPFLRDSYKWFKCIGLLPYYKKQIRGTNFKVPVIPPIDAGYITTFLDSKKEQQFRYYYNQDTSPVKKMRFERLNHMPGLDGRLRSPVAGLLCDFRTVRLIRRSTEIATHTQAHQQHIFEYHPGKQMTGDDNMETLESYGDSIAATVLAQQENLNEMRTDIRRSHLQSAVASAVAANMTHNRPTKLLRSDPDSDQWERNNANLLDRGIPLRPDFSYKTVPAPKVTTSITEVSSRLDRLACVTFDIPYDLIESHGNRSTANVQGNLRFLNERIKEWNRTFTGLTKRVFYLLFGKVLQRDLTDFDIEVYMPCTPVASLADVVMLADQGYMERETAAYHIFNILGLPHSDIHVTEVNPAADSASSASGGKLSNA